MTMQPNLLVRYGATCVGYLSGGKDVKCRSAKLIR